MAWWRVPILGGFGPVFSGCVLCVTVMFRGFCDSGWVADGTFACCCDLVLLFGFGLDCSVVVGWFPGYF